MNCIYLLGCFSKLTGMSDNQNDEVETEEQGSGAGSGADTSTSSDSFILPRRRGGNLEERPTLILERYLKFS